MPSAQSLKSLQLQKLDNKLDCTDALEPSIPEQCARRLARRVSCPAGHFENFEKFKEARKGF